MSDRLKVGIVGCGFVGGALKDWIAANNSDGCECFVSDPPKGMNDDLSSVDIVFVQIHVPTEKDGTQDLTLLSSIISGLPDVPVFVRTTILPGTSSRLSGDTGHDVRYMPEFLTERTSLEDFSRQTLTFTGHVDLLSRIFKGRTYVEMSPLDAEIAKYAHNVFGALKVTYFNAIRDYCIKTGADWGNVRRGCLLSGYINADHTSVPGPDGFFGYGGKCFPKDVDAFSSLTHDMAIGRLIAPLHDLNTSFRHTRDERTNIVRDMAPASTACKVAAHVTSLNTPGRYGFLMEAVRSLNTIPGMSVFVHTDKDDGLSFIEDSATVVVHSMGDESPLRLSTKSRQMIYDFADAYDYVIYIEDDVSFTVSNFNYYLKYHNAANDAGYYLGFLLTETRDVTGEEYLCVQTGQTADNGFTDLLVGGDKFFTVNDHEYNPFWIADRATLKRFITDFQDVFWLRSGFVYGSPWMIRENAASGPAFTMFEHMAYVDAPGLLVRHLSDKYTNIPWHPFGKNKVSDYVHNA